MLDTHDPDPAPLHRTMLQLGRRYRLLPASAGTAIADERGLTGGYHVTAECAELLPPGTPPACERVYLWDPDLPPATLERLAGADGAPLPEGVRLARNALTLLDGELVGPTICNEGERAVLAITPSFRVHLRTDAGQACLGVLQLVESTRTAAFEDGGELRLLDTHAQGGPVLYLPPSGQTEPIVPLGDVQPAGTAREYQYRPEITQPIPATLGGRTVTGVSVLERYHVYFLYCAVPADPDDHIWVPAHVPIHWGWSIRVNRRLHDGAWDIFRRKLMLPTAIHEGYAMPLWSDNSRRLMRACEG